MNKQLSQRLILVIWCISILSIALLPHKTTALANEPLELDGEFTSSTPLFDNNLGVIHFRFPTAMIVEEEAEVIRFSYNDAEARLSHGVVAVTSGINVKSLEDDDEVFTPYIVGETTFDEFVENYANDVASSGQEIVLSQTELQIESYRVIELVTIGLGKSSMFIIDAPIPLIFEAASFDHYSDVLRNTVFNMVASLEVDWETMFEPRDLSNLLEIAEPLYNIPMGIFSTQSVNSTNRMLSYGLQGQNVFYIEVKLVDSRSQVTLILADAKGQRLKQIAGHSTYNVTEATYYSELKASLRIPDGGNYTLLIGILGNEWDYRIPQEGDLEFVYKKAEALPFSSESPSGAVHAFIVDDASALSSITTTIDYGAEDGNRNITKNIYPLDIIELKDLDGTSIQQGGISSNPITFSPVEGSILIVVKDNIDLYDRGADSDWNTEPIFFTVEVD